MVIVVVIVVVVVVIVMVVVMVMVVVVVGFWLLTESLSEPAAHCFDQID